MALAEPVDRAVITVPANFNELQRAATKVAGRVAGLDVLRIINEPTAAALAYGLGRAQRERIAVYDFGGGTFDCTLLDLSGNVFEVLATAGDTFLGGDDLDLAISDRMAEAFLRQHRYDPRTDPQAFERLRVAAEEIKISLSLQDRASVRLREVGFGVHGAHLDLDFGMTRAELETLATPWSSAPWPSARRRSRSRTSRSRRSTRRSSWAAPRASRSSGRGSSSSSAGRRSTASIPTRSWPSAPPSRPLRSPRSHAARAYLLRRCRADRDAPIRRSRRTSSPASPAASEDENEDAVTITASVSELLRRTRQSSSSSGSTAPAPAVQRTVTQRMGSAAPPPAPESVPDPAPTLPRPLKYADVVRSTQQQQMSSTLPMNGAPPLPPAAPMPPMRPGIEPTPSPLPAVLTTQTTPFSAPHPAPVPAPASVPPPFAPIGMPELPPLNAPVPVLVDVTPRALVVETAGGWCDVVVQRNAKIPCDRTRAFTTSSDSQEFVRVRVAQGEDPVFGRNTFLGQVELTGLRAAPRGEVVIQVRFEVDESGTLKVFATDVATRRETHATLQLVGIGSVKSIAAMLARHADTKVM